MRDSTPCACHFARFLRLPSHSDNKMKEIAHEPEIEKGYLLKSKAEVLYS
jgi:hypothetical protein